MISKNIKQFIVAGSVCCSVVAALTACSDWSDHYDGVNAAPGSDQTLWQQMSSNPQLTDFCEVLEQTKVFRMHKKTAVSYADLMKGGQLFTLVAPVNGTFNKDSLLRLVQTNQGDSVVEKFFIKNHLSRSVSSLTAENKKMLMLNSKLVELTANTIEGVSIIEANNHANNGVLHVASKPLPYQYSLYETLCDRPEFNVAGEALRKYDEDWFDADASVSSGIVEGVPVYVDSVVIERNRILDHLGYLKSEDSLYWAVVPTANGWTKAWQEAETYFVYDEKTNKRDSLQHRGTTCALYEDAIFNMTDQKKTTDSLISVQYNRNEPQFHVFYKPFGADGILANAKPITCSNGILYQTDEWPFKPQDTYFRELWSEGETQSLITDHKLCIYETQRVSGDSISKGAYLDIIPTDNQANWEMTYRINNTLSGTYDICVVVLPKSVANQVNPDMKPNKFQTVINYVDTNGSSKSFNCNNTQFQNNPQKVDTIVVAEAFHFPTCNYGQNDIKASVTIKCSISSKQNKSYNREMLLDCIYLRPHTEKSEEQ